MYSGFCVLVMVIWSGYLITPHEQLTYDAKKHSIEDVVARAEVLDSYLTLLRTGFSVMIGGTLGGIVLVALVPSRIRSNEFEIFRSFLIRMIPYVVGLPFTSLTAKFQSVKYHLAVDSLDLGKYSMLVDNATAWGDVLVGNESSNFQTGSASSWSNVETNASSS
jgi:hypothetical protein